MREKVKSRQVSASTLETDLYLVTRAVSGAGLTWGTRISLGVCRSLWLANARWYNFIAYAVLQRGGRGTQEYGEPRQQEIGTSATWTG